MEDKDQIEKGNTLLSWHFPEFEKPERTMTWYIVLFVGAAILVLWAMIEKNFLFAVIIVMSVIIILLLNRKEPVELNINIMEAGIQIGKKFYMYKEMKNFFVIYEPPQVSMVFIILKNRAKPRISIPLNGQNPVKVRDLLLNFVEEDLDKDDEPGSDYLIRALKL
ncbi:MAG TPA: hypothetical protein PLD95_01420 [bacterium]|jgi:hypothetical protein|nr:hypothetical protein [bacterium]HOG38108.1 hypothetical protein [bacterium]HQI03164.1 hypothetical protein [bacterium]